MEKYSSGWRGAPAKGVGRLRGARVQIPPSPYYKPWFFKVYFFCKFSIWNIIFILKNSYTSHFVKANKVARKYLFYFSVIN